MCITDACICSERRIVVCRLGLRNAETWKVNMRRLSLLVVLASLAGESGVVGQEAGQETLWTAARKGDAAAVEALLAAGAEVNATNPAEYGKTALHLAAEKGH